VDIPKPVPGLVIRYSYLWRAEYLQGRDEGSKARPCAIVLAVQKGEGGERVTVLPVTHAEPTNRELALEIPLATKKRLGLDGERSWIVLTEANQFDWPGPDLRPIQIGGSASVSYGQLSQRFFHRLREKFVRVLRAQNAGVVRRQE